MSRRKSVYEGIFDANIIAVFLYSPMTAMHFCKDFLSRIKLQAMATWIAAMMVSNVMA